jgi:hypothetical protein
MPFSLGREAEKEGGTRSCWHKRFQSSMAEANPTAVMLHKRTSINDSAIFNFCPRSGGDDDVESDSEYIGCGYPHLAPHPVFERLWRLLTRRWRRRDAIAPSPSTSYSGPWERLWATGGQRRPRLSFLVNLVYGKSARQIISQRAGMVEFASVQPYPARLHLP